MNTLEKMVQISFVCALFYAIPLLQVFYLHIPDEIKKKYEKRYETYKRLDNVLPMKLEVKRLKLKLKLTYLITSRTKNIFLYLSVTS